MEENLSDLCSEATSSQGLQIRFTFFYVYAFHRGAGDHILNFQGSLTTCKLDSKLCHQHTDKSPPGQLDRAHSRLISAKTQELADLILLAQVLVLMGKRVCFEGDYHCRSTLKPQ